MAQTLQTLEQFIRDEIGYHGELDPDMNLLDSKVLDSFNVVEMAGFVQETFGVEFEADDLVRENFATLSALRSLIERRLNAG